MARPKILRQGEAAKMLGVTRKTLIDWEHRGYIRRIPRPGAWYQQSAIRAFLVHGNPQAVRRVERVTRGGSPA